MSIRMTLLHRPYRIAFDGAYDDSAIEDIAASISERGQIVPGLIVRTRAVAKTLSDRFRPAQIGSRQEAWPEVPRRRPRVQ
jgi:hypothetical protein